MAKPEHRTPEYRAAKEACRPVVEAGLCYCAEPVCLMGTRWIAPGTPWDLSHDWRTGRIIGPSHRRCNRSEAAIRRNGGQPIKRTTRW